MLTTDDINWTIECLPEDEGPEESFATGDDKADKAICDKIREQMEWNEWAWCVVHVSGHWKGLSADDYLGGCSYRSEQDFMSESGYYEGMRAEILAELNRMAADISVNYG